MSERYDLAIGGSGSGAFATAIEGVRKDQRVAMVEDGAVGGTCVNVGCIPSKVLLAAGEAAHSAGHQHEVGYLTSTTAMGLQAVPESLIVAGGNYVGLEQAQFFSRIGTDVTVLEVAERIAPAEEPELSDALAGVLTDEGLAVHAGADVTRTTRVAGDGDGVVITAEVDGSVKEFRAQQLLMATGRRPNTDGLGPEAVGVDTGERGEVAVDAGLRTTNPAVYAVGDITGHPQFIYVAGAHGKLAVDNAFDDAGPAVDYTTMPRVAFTQPQLAAAGLTDAEADAQHLDCTCEVLDLAAVPRALVNRDTRGLVKSVAETATGRIRGVHVLADDAGDVILAAVYALEAGWTVDTVANLWAPYLTMAESLKLAAQAFRGDVSLLSCCAV